MLKNNDVQPSIYSSLDRKQKDKENPQLSGDMDIDSLPILHIPSIQPSQKNTNETH